MAVFVASADESTGRTHTDPFLFGGFVARERLWSKSFAPLWDRRVLAGPPRIPYLHMADIKSPKWCAEHGLTQDDAERRLDAAFELIDRAGGLYPVAYRVDAGHLRSAFAEAEVKLVIKTEGGIARRAFEPDYICFLQWAFRVLRYVEQQYPDAENVDFVIERNGRITKHLHRFHTSMAKVLSDLGADRLARLMGDFSVGGKERVPLQAADLLVWHTQAAQAGSLSVSDERRYDKLAHHQGWLEEATDDEITNFARRAKEALLDPNDEDADALDLA